MIPYRFSFLFKIGLLKIFPFLKVETIYSKIILGFSFVCNAQNK